MRRPAVCFWLPSASSPLTPMVKWLLLFHPLGLRFGVALFQAERPLDAAQQMLLKGLGRFRRVLALAAAVLPIRVPHVLAMAEGGVKDAALAVFLAPRDR